MAFKLNDEYSYYVSKGEFINNFIDLNWLYYAFSNVSVPSAM